MNVSAMIVMFLVCQGEMRIVLVLTINKRYSGLPTSCFFQPVKAS